MKLNETLISTILGVIVVLIIGILTFNYFSNVRPAEGNSHEHTHQGQILHFEAEGYNWEIFRSFDKELNIVCYYRGGGFDCIKLGE